MYIICIQLSYMYVIHQFSDISATCRLPYLTRHWEEASLELRKKLWKLPKAIVQLHSLSVDTPRQIKRLEPENTPHPWEIIFQSIMFRFYVNLPGLYHILLHGLVGLFFFWRWCFPMKQVNVSDQHIEIWSFGLIQPMEVPKKGLRGSQAIRSTNAMNFPLFFFVSQYSYPPNQASKCAKSFTMFFSGWELISCALVKLLLRLLSSHGFCAETVSNPTFHSPWPSLSHRWDHGRSQNGSQRWVLQQFQ